MSENKQRSMRAIPKAIRDAMKPGESIHDVCKRFKKKDESPHDVLKRLGVPIIPPDYPIKTRRGKIIFINMNEFYRLKSIPDPKQKELVYATDDSRYFIGPEEIQKLKSHEMETDKENFPGHKYELPKLVDEEWHRRQLKDKPNLLTICDEFADKYLFHGYPITGKTIRQWRDEAINKGINPQLLPTKKVTSRK